MKSLSKKEILGVICIYAGAYIVMNQVYKYSIHKGIFIGKALRDAELDLLHAKVLMQPKSDDNKVVNLPFGSGNRIRAIILQNRKAAADAADTSTGNPAA